MRHALLNPVFGPCRASYATVVEASIETCFHLRRGCATLPSGVGLAAGFMLAAGRGTIRFVDQNVVVASGTNHAVNCFAELIVGRACGVFAARLFAANGHVLGSDSLTKTL